MTRRPDPKRFMAVSVIGLVSVCWPAQAANSNFIGELEAKSPTSDLFQSEFPRRVSTQDDAFVSTAVVPFSAPSASPRAAVLPPPTALPKAAAVSPVEDDGFRTTPASQSGALSAPAEPFTVQAGAFQSISNAKRLADQLSRFGHARTVKTERDGATLYRVLVGAWPEAEQAQPMLDLIRDRGFEGFVTRDS